MSTELLTQSVIHGPVIGSDGAVTFRIWAPGCASMRLELPGENLTLEMAPVESGWYELTTSAARVGTRYRFVLPDGLRVPDPASRYQPEDVHGSSEVVDPAAWMWDDAGWRGRAWNDAVIYELHVGAFTPEGTFRAAIDKLDHLAAVGVTAIELMPVADFPGGRNWGYDGVLLYAPDSSYGRPEDLKALVEAAHARGLMVFLDVVYNHFGPDGNYLASYAPEFFTERHKTPWGAAVNYDGAGSTPVREFVVQNAIYWVRDFHIDGLRLDAVHAILDDSPTHLLEELALRVRRAVPDRTVHLVLENEENQSRRLERDAGNSLKRYTAQWNDDVHHVLHTAVSGEDTGYYAEYRGDTAKLGRALAEGFAFQGEMMTYRGEPRGERSAHLPPGAFVAFLQNHDQIGNRAMGDRIHATASQEAVRAASAVYLLLPQTPMLFMGEEWGATSPFPFFCDFGPELAEAVRTGRRAEFAKFPEFQDAAQRERIPDPQAPDTFASGKLNWAEIDEEEHRRWLEWYRRILAARRDWIVPLRHSIAHGGTYEILGEGAVSVRWQLASGGELALDANLSAERVQGVSHVSGLLIWEEGSGSAEGALGPWTVRWWLDPAPPSGKR